MLGLHDSTEREVLWPFYRWENHSSERSTHLPKVSELGSSRAQIQIQAYLTPYLMRTFLLGCCWHSMKTVADQPLIVLLTHFIFKKWQLPKYAHLNLRENVKLEGIWETAFADATLWLRIWGYTRRSDKVWRGSDCEVHARTKILALGLPGAPSTSPKNLLQQITWGIPSAGVLIVPWLFPYKSLGKVQFVSDYHSVKDEEYILWHFNNH